MTEVGQRPKHGGILIVDDDPISRLMLRRALTRFTNVRVVDAIDGVQGLEVALELRPQIIFLDNQMPGRDGLELLRELRAESGFTHTPVVMVTGSFDPSDVIAAAELGAAGFLSKPVSHRQLDDKVGHLLHALDDGSDE